MLTKYIQAAIDSIAWRLMTDGSFSAEIPQLGLNINTPHLEECQGRIREMLEEYVVSCLVQGKALPAIGGVELKAGKNQVSG